jgi:hypothetical protein
VRSRTRFAGSTAGWSYAHPNGGAMPSMTRDELAEEILRTVEMPRLIAAAAVMLRVQRGGEVAELSADELAKFVEGLDVLGLETLRAVAVKLEGGMEH